MTDRRDDATDQRAIPSIINISVGYVGWLVGWLAVTHALAESNKCFNDSLVIPHFSFLFLAKKKQNMYEGLCVYENANILLVSFFGAHYGIPSDDHISRNFVSQAKTKKRMGELKT